MVAIIPVVGEGLTSSHSDRPCVTNAITKQQRTHVDLFALPPQDRPLGIGVIEGGNRQTPF